MNVGESVRVASERRTTALRGLVGEVGVVEKKRPTQGGSSLRVRLGCLSEEICRVWFMERDLERVEEVRA